MGKPTVDHLARDLARLLSDMAGTYGELAMHMRDKLDAIRRADADGIASITAREMTLAGRLAERHGLRRQMMRALQQGLGLDGGPMQVADLAERLGEPRRSQLLTVAAGLRKQLSALEPLRMTSALATQQMLGHLQQILSVMTAGAPGSDTYGRSGGRQPCRTGHVFEAVG